VPQNKIVDLRNHLFAALEGLADKEHPLELDRARAIADVAKVVIETAKVEVSFLKVVDGGRGSGFLPVDPGIEETAGPKKLTAGAGRR
jgi:hypothetical protein